MKFKFFNARVAHAAMNGLSKAVAKLRGVPAKEFPVIYQMKESNEVVNALADELSQSGGDPRQILGPLSKPVLKKKSPMIETYDRREREHKAATAPASVPAPAATTPPPSSLSSDLMAFKAEVASLRAELAAAKTEKGIAAKPKSLTFGELKECAAATFGKDVIESWTRQSASAEELKSRIERNFYASSLSVPGHDLNHIRASFGDPKPVIGLRRIEHAQQQAKIDKYLTLKSNLQP